MRHLIGLVLIFCVSHQVMAAPEVAAFKSEEEMVQGWYHRHEIDSWIRRGASRDTVDGVLSNIKNSKGKRRVAELVDTQLYYGPGHWVYEWEKAGDDAIASAGKDNISKLKEALAYYTIASWPHLGEKEDKDALAKARDVYLKLAKASSLDVRHVSFDVAETQSKGYLHMPEGTGPFPLLIFTYGSDVTKEDGFEIFSEEFAPRSIAVLTVDLTGIGEADHIPLLQGSDLVLAGARRYVSTLSNIDQNNVFVAGASFGGNAAARYYANGHPAAGVISMCGPLHRPFVAPPEVYDQLPALTMDGVKARLGIPGADSKRLREHTPALSLKQLLSEGDKNQTPLLIFTTSDDPVAPLADLPLLENKAVAFDKVVLKAVGHCPPRWVRQPVISRWIRQHIR